MTGRISNARFILTEILTGRSDVASISRINSYDPLAGLEWLGRTSP